MATITLTRPVIIKAVVTEGFKRLYVQDLEDAIKRVDELVVQIETQARRLELERQVSSQTRALRQQLETERQRQELARAELGQRLREAQNLELGSEFAQGTIEGSVDVAVGDNLFNKIGRTEVIVKDGIVLEIRESP